MMSRLTTPAESTLSDATLEQLEPFKLKGKIAPVYLQMGNSDAALSAYLSMETALKSSTLGSAEIETIKLLVSQITGCDYCLSIHHMKATVAGLDDEQKLKIRRRETLDDPRLDAIVKTVARFFEQPGALYDSEMQRLAAAGFSNAEMVDLVLAVSTIAFTNFFNHINKTQSPLPAAPLLTD